MLDFSNTPFEDQISLYADVARDKLNVGDVTVDYLQSIMTDDPTDSFSVGCRSAIDEYLGVTEA